jgi:broad-specificity NMP kinase
VSFSFPSFFWFDVGRLSRELNILDRKYSEAKLQENLDSEIMEVLLQEARDSYAEQIVVELPSNDSDQMESNVDRIEEWIKQWKNDNSERQDGQ